MKVLTTDVFCGAYLMIRGRARLVSVLVDGNSNRPSGTFVFEAGDGCDLLDLQEQYSTGRATCPVKELRDAVSQLRAALARALSRPIARRSSAV
jgi:hypothetical protein